MICLRKIIIFMHFFSFITAIVSILLGYFLYDGLTHISSPMFILFAGMIDIIGICIFTVGLIFYAIVSINNAIKQKKLETENIVLQTIKPIDDQFGRKLFYRLSKLYQIYIKRINNNKIFDIKLRQLFIDLDNQLYNSLMSLKNQRTLENNLDKNNAQLQSLDMAKHNNPIYLKLYKEIILKEEVEQMEACFNEFKEYFPYYENNKTETEFSQFLDDLYSMIMEFKNNEINSLSDYEQREHEIWKILDSIKVKRSGD